MTVHYLPRPEVDHHDDGPITSIEICDRAGITYRQLDYWARTGILDAQPRRRSSGIPRGFTPDQVSLACLLKRLLDGGLALRTAANAARELLDTGTTHIAGFPVHLPDTEL